MTKASDNVFPRLLISEGGSSATPAAGNVTVYAKADGLLYSKDDAGTETVLGATSALTDQGTATYLDFTTATAPASPAAGKIRVYSKTGDTLAQKTSGGTETLFGAGGGISWTQDINETGSSVANWTVVSGSWASAGGLIQQATVSASFKTLTYTAQVPMGYPTIAEAEIRFPATGQGTGALVHAGFVVGALGVLLNRGGPAIHFQDYGVTDHRTVSVTLSLDIWYKLRAVISGTRLSTYVDGALIATSVIPSVTASDKFSLASYNSLPDFRNIKLWTLSGGAPA